MDLLKEITKTIDPNDWIGFDRENFQSFDGSDMEKMADNIQNLSIDILSRFIIFQLDQKITIVKDGYLDSKGNPITTENLLQQFLRK